MKIGIFNENSLVGGVDTFILNLINAWPVQNDDFTIICNNSHPGFKYIKQHAVKKCSFIGHKCYLPWMLSGHISFIRPILVVKVLTQLYYYLSIPYLFIHIYQLLRAQKIDQLLVVNGGYPAGLSCRDPYPPPC